MCSSDIFPLTEHLWSVTEWCDECHIGSSPSNHRRRSEGLLSLSLDHSGSLTTPYTLHLCPWCSPVWNTRKHHLDLKKTQWILTDFFFTIRSNILQQHFWSSAWWASAWLHTAAGWCLWAFSSPCLCWVWLKEVLTLCREEAGTLLQVYSLCMNQGWRTAGGADGCGCGVDSHLGPWAYLTRSCEPLEVLCCCCCCECCRLLASVQSLRWENIG